MSGMAGPHSPSVTWLGRAIACALGPGVERGGRTGWGPASGDVLEWLTPIGGPPWTGRPPPPRKKGKNHLWLLEGPVRKMIPQMHTPSAHKSVLESANPRTDSEGASGCTWSTARATARLRDGRPPE